MTTLSNARLRKESQCVHFTLQIILLSANVMKQNKRENTTSIHILYTCSSVTLDSQI